MASGGLFRGRMSAALFPDVGVLVEELWRKPLTGKILPFAEFSLDNPVRLSYYYY